MFLPRKCRERRELQSGKKPTNLSPFGGHLQLHRIRHDEMKHPVEEFRAVYMRG